MSEFHELRRKIPKEAEADLVVAGGGPAGTAAAICAARQGLRVVLVEGTGCLGGMGTNGLVSNWYSLSDGNELIVRGLFFEILCRLFDEGQLPPGTDPRSREWQANLHSGTGFNPEGLKRLLDRMCHEAGVEVRFCTRLIDADFRSGCIEGMITHGVEGYRYIPCRMAVDATGDAVLAHLCGAETVRAGKDTEHIMPPTLCAVLTDIDYGRFHRGLQQEMVHQALKDGFFSQQDRHVPGIFRTGKNTAIQNSGHIFGMDALDPASLSGGYRKGRELAAEYLEFARQYLDGCGEAQLVATAPLMGVRESRRIRGKYVLTYEDFCKRRHFADQVGIYNKAVDIHVYDTSDEQWERYCEEFEKMDRLGEGESYGLPYRILVSPGLKNLWVAGRCSSSDRKVNGAIRDQPACYILGEAAGMAAVQALESGETAESLDTDRLQDVLRAQGGHIPACP